MEEKEILLEEGQSLVIKLPNGSEKLKVLNNGTLVVDSIESKDNNKYLRADVEIDCEEWFSQFMEIHNKLKEIALSDEGKEERLHASLCLYQLCDSETFKPTGKCMDLSLCNGYSGNTLITVATLVLDDENDDVFKYLFAKVVDYYLAVNYANTKISLFGDEYATGTLYSNEKEKDIYGERMISPTNANLYTVLNNDHDYRKIFEKLVDFHNVGMPSNFYIDKIRNDFPEVITICDDLLKDSIEKTEHNKEIVNEIFKEKTI